MGRLYHGKDDLSMAIRTFLAMTAAEIGEGTSLPPKIAWMACHFSPYSTGLSNRPRSLPPDSLLILNDRTPIHRHDPEVIAAQLAECVENLQCSGVLLDFQRPNCQETAALAALLPGALPCPVAVSALYAGESGYPVFLPPVPHHTPLADHLAPWQDREIWLELALDGEIITLTESGVAFAPLPSEEALDGGHAEDALHCHYRVELLENAAKFTLWRTPEDLKALLDEAGPLGVSHAVGLYQELREAIM